MYGLGWHWRHLVDQRRTSTVLRQEASNQSTIATAELNFVQISDSHIGFNKPANTDVIGTFRETILHINELPKVPEFLLHSGDLTHLSDPVQFDTLAQVLKDCRTKDVFYVPGEHDIYDGGALYQERHKPEPVRRNPDGNICLNHR